MSDNKKTDSSALETTEFLVRLKSYDLEAYDELVRGFRDRIYNLALRLLRNTEDAEEILQETFLSVFDKIHTFQGRSRLSTWIYAIASNSALSRLRKKSEQSVTFNDETALNISKTWLRNSNETFDLNKNDPVVLKELQEHLEEAIRTLPDAYREIFILKEVQMMSIKHIAPLFKLKPGAVKTRLHRARLMLRAKLSDYWNEGKQ